MSEGGPDDPETVTPSSEPRCSLACLHSRSGLSLVPIEGSDDPEPKEVCHATRTRRLLSFRDHGQATCEGILSETHVKRGRPVVHGDKELYEKLGRNDPCPCGSGQGCSRSAASRRVAFDGVGPGPLRTINQTEGPEPRHARLRPPRSRR